MNIKELLNKFQISLDLPVEILEFKSNTNYENFKVINMVLPYISISAHIDYKEFEVYMFYSTNHRLIIAPNNFYNMLGVYKKLGEGFIGHSFDFKGKLVSTT